LKEGNSPGSRMMPESDDQRCMNDKFKSEWVYFDVKTVKALIFLVI
jgi:hypothetical protein